ncbi:MAG: sulfatase [Candidatus Eisenbacteria bacterium]
MRTGRTANRAPFSRVPSRGRVPGIAVLFSLGALFALSCSMPSPEREKPNIFLITIESLRADHVGCYGYAKPTTPNIDRLAAEGTRCTGAYAVTSWTLTSHATLFTGLYPSAHRVVAPRDALAESHLTLAEALRDSGYQCAGFVSGPFLTTPYNLHQGFEIYDQSPSSITQDAAHSDVTNPEMEEDLVRFLEEQKDADRPFFLFAYFWDVHYDFLPPAPYDTLFVPEGARPFDVGDFEGNPRIHPNMDPVDLAYLISQYDGEIRCTDDLLGRLWDRLRDLGLWENTIVVLTADHGEEFFEHGTKGHKNNLFVESVRVPLVIKWADGRGPAVDSRLTGLIDLFTTLAGAAGSPARTADSRDLAGEARGGTEPFFQELVTSLYGRGPSGRMEKRSEQWWAVHRGRYRLLSVPDRGLNMIYDVEADRREERPLGVEQSELVEEYLLLFSPWHARMRSIASGHEDPGRVHLTPEEVERLRALGYIEK